MEVCDCAPTSSVLLAGSQLGLFGTLSSVFGALFGSSCCIIQLILNVFSVGCSGFAIFDPYSNFFNALSLGGIGALIYSHHQTKTLWTDRKFHGTLLISLLLFSTPHAVRFVNEFAGRKSAPAALTLTVEVEGMKCLACANSVHNVMNSIPGVEDSSVSLENGICKLILKEGSQVGLQDVITALEPQGYIVKLHTEA